MSHRKYYAGRTARTAAALTVSVFCAAPLLRAAARSHRPSSDVLTYHNDNARTGQDLGETALTPDLVGAPGRFGKICSWPVDGQVYAQPLYVSGLRIAGKGKRNVVFVCTEHDTVYAFDANVGDPSQALLWKRSFLNPLKGITSVPSDEVSSGGDLTPEIGITGTPVIDRRRNTLYVVAKTKEGAAQDDSAYVQRLHALDLTSGDERKEGPVKIEAVVSGHGDGSDHDLIHFSARRQNQRPGLLLNDGIVYIGWASHADHGPYQGWILAYDAHSLKQLAVWNSAPNGGLSGVWMSGAGLAADDSGDIYFSTGNGSADPNVASFGDSIVRLKMDRKAGLKVADFFMPYNHEEINAQDADLCSSVMLLPSDAATNHKDLLIGGGKQGFLYLVDRNNMGHVGTDHDNVVQRFNPGAGAFDAFALYGDTLYYAGNGGNLRSFRLEAGKVRETPLAQTSIAYGFPGCSPSVSADGDRNAIVWAIEQGAPGALHAYDATDLRRELFSSRRLDSDDMGQSIKFTVPTVADGHVFVGGANRVTVYGLLPAGAAPAAGAPASAPADTVAETAGPVAGLVGRWPFDEGSGATARDGSIGANGNSDADASVQGEVTRIPGVVGSGALDLHGVGNAVSRVVIPDRPRFRFGRNDSFTLSLWVSPSASAPINRAIAVATRANPIAGAPPIWGLWITPDRHWSFGAAPGANGAALIGGDVRAGWRLITVVQDAAAGSRKLLVDGREVASGPAAPLDAPGDLWLGGAANTERSSLVGAIDDFRIYSRALGREELDALKALGKPGGR